ncbi:MAG: thioesterase [Oscillospiraceae bacterium]
MSGCFEQKFVMTASDVDRWQRLRPSVLFRMLQEISIAHTEALGAGRSKTLDKGVLWVVTRVRLEVERLPRYDERVILSSWPGETMRVIFPRYYQMETESGEILLRASSLWLLMNQKERHFVFPEELGVIVPGFVRGDELFQPESIVPPETQKSLFRKVAYSELDLNGHMNNTRYLDWLFDLFPASFHKEHTLRGVEINFSSETKPDATVELRWKYSENELFAKGFCDVELFEAKLRFDDCKVKRTAV